jgi:hypothetical protein
MGIWRKTFPLKLSDAERMSLMRLHDALAPRYESLSQTARWAFWMMEFVVCTPGMLARFVRMFQEAECEQSVCTVLQTAAAREARIKKPPVKVQRPVALAGRGPLRFSATTTKRTGTSATVRAWRTSYGDFRPVFAATQGDSA